MKSCRVYENESMRDITGDTLRPGGFLLTEKAIKICQFNRGDKILDVGCGMGATVEKLNMEYQLDAYGIDPSSKLIEMGRSKFKNTRLKYGIGENIPFEDVLFQGVLAECTMSLMDDFEKTIREVKRVLKLDGYFTISDVYARKPENLEGVKKHHVESCMRGLFDVEILKNALLNVGFEIVCFEDCSDLLNELMVKIIFKHGSMEMFWNVATCSNCGDFAKKLKLAKPGYFFLIAKKK